jgi:RNA polymerase sigma-70 factor, ECF subfamily
MDQAQKFVTNSPLYRSLMLDGEDNIIREAIQGEASAFGLLYDHYQPQIYRFVFLKVGQREEAEDLTHQIFLNAWQNIRSYRHLGHPFSSWLYQIARNQVIDHYRTKKQDIGLEAVAEFAVALDKSAVGLEHRLELEKVMAAVHTLKPIYQDIIVMRFVEELSLKEVATALKKSEGAIKLLQHRAMKQLKIALNSKQA